MIPFEDPARRRPAPVGAHLRYGDRPAAVGVGIVLDEEKVVAVDFDWKRVAEEASGGIRESLAWGPRNAGRPFSPALRRTIRSRSQAVRLFATTARTTVRAAWLTVAAREGRLESSEGASPARSRRSSWWTDRKAPSTRRADAQAAASRVRVSEQPIAQGRRFCDHSREAVRDSDNRRAWPCRCAAHDSQKRLGALAGRPSSIGTSPTRRGAEVGPSQDRFGRQDERHDHVELVRCPRARALQRPSLTGRPRAWRVADRTPFCRATRTADMPDAACVRGDARHRGAPAAAGITAVELERVRSESIRATVHSTHSGTIERLDQDRDAQHARMRVTRVTA